MNCFKLPKSLVNEIEKLCNRFWWGGQPGQKKLHWAKWSAISRAKCAGGMGFKDLESFNKALLANQGWKVINEPQCLLSRIWKHRYFKSTDFMNARSCRMGSYTFKSVLWSRDVLAAGLKWRIGNGKDVCIYQDKWINRESTFKVFSNPVLGWNAKVSELIDEGGNWRMDILNSNFLRLDVGCIKNIPLAKTDQKDVLRWHYDKSSLYNVRSGYRLVVELKNQPSSSDSAGNIYWWKLLWKLNIPSKIHIVIWKVYHEWIPVRTNLISRGMDIEHCCPFCNAESGTVLHSLL